MTEYYDHSTTNVAHQGSVVGIQAESVHNSDIYVTAPGDPPEKIYQVGVNYLDNGVPLPAREKITEAIARDHDGAHVRFHWALSVLSKRSYAELTLDERDQLRRLPDHVATYPDDEWSHAVTALCELLDQLGSPDQDPTPTLKKLSDLPAQQRDKIVRHCDLVLTGGLKDGLWAEMRRAAEDGRFAGDRTNRAWAYFQPEPARPRVRSPAPSTAGSDDVLWALLGIGLLAAALGGVARAVLQVATPTAVLGYLVMVACGVTAAVAGSRWRYRQRRLTTKERECASRFRSHAAPAGGFANRVDHAFQYYAHKYAPEGVDRSVWLAYTEGLRASLRDEVVEQYRESRIQVGRVTWLIRYMIRGLRQQWYGQRLFEHRERYRTPTSTKAWCVSALVVGALALCAVITTAVHAAPLLAAASVLAAAAGARLAVRRSWRVLYEHWRIADENREQDRRSEARQAEYIRWSNKLAATRPTDAEMENWLWCDRIVLIDDALQHYQLAWREITAHTILQTPTTSCERARVHGGPWRYSKYELRLFLITTEGVRELATTLAVKKGAFDGNERGHFRFDAFSSLRVIEAGAFNYTLQLTLTNGPTRTINVTEPERNIEEAAVTDEQGLSKMSLESTGFSHALHVLEGISAEGKAWIRRGTGTPPPDGPAEAAA